MAGPLEGVRVLELAEIIAGPFAGMLLADMGADVIKVEPPWGEAWRLHQQFTPGESRVFMAVNRGKRSLPLDLSRPEGREVVQRLLEGLDVAIVNYRPGVAERLGVDYETLSASNPRLVYCENTAFGSNGPARDLPGYDIIVQAMSGLMAAEGKTAQGVPQHIFTPVVDVSTGIAMAWAICAALYARERSGAGQKVDASLLATALGMQGSRFLRVEGDDEAAQRELLERLEALQANEVSYEELQEQYLAYHAPSPGNIYYRTYRTRDGAIAVGCLSDPLRKKLLDVLGLEDIRFDPDYQRDSPEALAYGEELTLKGEKLFGQRTTTEWLATLDAAGVPAGPVRFTEELLEDPQILANGLVTNLEHQLAGKVSMAGPLISMSETPLGAKSASPALGQHTDDLLTELGYAPAQIRKLKDLGVTR